MQLTLHCKDIGKYGEPSTIWTSDSNRSYLSEYEQATGFVTGQPRV